MAGVETRRRGDGSKNVWRVIERKIIWAGWYFWTEEDRFLPFVRSMTQSIAFDVVKSFGSSNHQLYAESFWSLLCYSNVSRLGVAKMTWNIAREGQDRSIKSAFFVAFRRTIRCLRAHGQRFWKSYSWHRSVFFMRSWEFFFATRLKHRRNNNCWYCTQFVEVLWKNILNSKGTQVWAALDTSFECSQPPSKNCGGASEPDSSVWNEHFAKTHREGNAIKSFYRFAAKYSSLANERGIFRKQKP